VRAERAVRAMRAGRAVIMMVKVKIREIVI
jgi:hypothetical protein